MDSSGKPRRNLLQQPTIAVGITEGGERPVSPVSGSGPPAGPFVPRWKISLTSILASTIAFRATSMFETTRYVLCAEPGVADVRFLPNWTEQAEPCGVNWNTPEPGGVTSCLHPSLR